MTLILTPSTSAGTWNPQPSAPRIDFPQSIVESVHTPVPEQVDPSAPRLLPKALRHMTFPENDTPEQLRHDLLAHFQALGLNQLTEHVGQDGLIRPAMGTLDKPGIRAAHTGQKLAYLERESNALRRRWSQFQTSFADGHEIDPKRIKPVLVPVTSGTPESELFRFATTLWSVPVSRGFGRRMRYLVMDEYHGKLMGIFALGDPVFNLRARDSLIGWNQQDRRDRLVNVMDGYIIGSMPPYSALLGGKLITSLIGSKEVSQDFSARYGATTGLISAQAKEAHLTFVTITSSMGRSSIYNRLHLKHQQNGTSLVELQPLGMTDGYGHFHLSEMLFARMRLMLLNAGHPYALGHEFGDGPNWRMRLIKVALKQLGLSPNLVRHGISREVFGMPLVENYVQVLKDGQKPVGVNRPSVRVISDHALERWVLPRAASRPEFREIRRDDYLGMQLAKLNT
jgi:hypothetical protein